MLPLNSWLVDRSRFSVGFECPTKRYLQYHQGGTGWSRKPLYAPYATGIYVHKGLETLLLGGDAKQAAEVAGNEYAEEAAAKGFDETDIAIQEEAWLVKCLVYGASKVLVPRILEAYEVLEVEHEGTRQVGDYFGTPIVQMDRPDILLRAKGSGSIFVGDWKTARKLDSQWADSFATNVQFMVGALGVEERLGIKVDGFVVFGLEKGERRRAYDRETKTYSGPKENSSKFCRIWYRGPIPPETDGTFETEKAKGFDKVPAWEVRSFVEHVDWLDSVGELAGLFALTTPYALDRFALGLYDNSLRAEESKWISWLNEPEAKMEWTSAAFQAWFEQLPRSFKCEDWMTGRRCPVEVLCKRHPGWQDPTQSYRVREPHHTTEVELLNRRKEVKVGD